MGDLPPAGETPLEGLLIVESADPGASGRKGYPVRLAVESATMAHSTPGLFTALGFALLGGLILNVMPCVLPVLGIKVLGFVRDAGAAPADRARADGAGILLSFALLAAILLILRASGAALGLCTSSMKPVNWCTWAASTASLLLTRMILPAPRSTCGPPCGNGPRVSRSAHR